MSIIGLQVALQLSAEDLACLSLAASRYLVALQVPAEDRWGGQPRCEHDLSPTDLELPSDRRAASEKPEAARALLQLDATPGLLEFGLELVRLLALDALLDRLGGLVHERLGLLQPEAGG
jgi:hypothetical protein